MYDEDQEPHFIFLLTPPYSGSTAIAQILNTSQKSMILHPRAEGQWLIPGLCKKDRWIENKKIDMKSIKSIWLHKYQEINRLVGSIDYVIEKSPPNMMRIEKIVSQFKRYSLVVNNRNPYAYCASTLQNNYRHNRKKENIIATILHWQEMSLKLMHLVKRMNIHFFTYEDFCSNPRMIATKIKGANDLLDTVKFNEKIQVKDYPLQKVLNQNERQISKLVNNEINLISVFLKRKPEILDFFSYDLM